MKNFVRLAAVTLTLLVSYAGPSSAAVIVCEPDDFATGTALATACAGVTLSVEQRASDIVVSEIPAFGGASTGTRVFGHNTDDFGWGNSDSNPETFRADFDSLTNFVSIDFIGNDSSDQGSLWIYDVSDVLLATLNTGIFSSGGIIALNYSSVFSDISYIRASGIGGDNINLDNLQFYASVPEPSSIGLMALGIFGFTLVRRRRSAI